MKLKPGKLCITKDGKKSLVIKNEACKDRGVFGEACDKCEGIAVGIGDVYHFCPVAVGQIKTKTRFRFHPFVSRTTTGLKKIFNDNKVIVENSCDIPTNLSVSIPTDWWCGYVALKRGVEIPEDWIEYSTVESDIDVHGGLTYSCVSGDYTVFGFDCNHYSDEHDPDKRNPIWLMKEAMRMEKNLKKQAKKFMKKGRLK
jgi:hypothetical protein